MVLKNFFNPEMDKLFNTCGLKFKQPKQEGQFAVA